ncbi:MAG: hypothetical protein QGD94_00100 [Planctomycetia bacterium]|nr:hypothetical protein [Planctomycetia bacterium]
MEKLDQRYVPPGFIKNQKSIADRPFTRIAYSPNGTLYLSQGPESISSYDKDLNFIRRVSSVISSPSMAVDSKGRIYVTAKGYVIRRGPDLRNADFQQWHKDVNPGHVFKYAMAQTYFQGLSRFDGKVCYALDGKGNVYVGGSLEKELKKFDENGQRLATFPTGPCTSLAVFPDGKFAIAFEGNVTVFDIKGKEVAKIKTLADEIAVGPEGALYAVDAKAGLIRRFNLEGEAVDFEAKAPYIKGNVLGGAEGTSPGAFKNPRIAVGPDGTIAVADDLAGKRLQLFRASGEYFYDPLTMGNLKATVGRKVSKVGTAGELELPVPREVEQNVFHIDEAVEFALPMENRADAEIDVAVTGAVVDLYGNRVVLEEQSVKVGPGQSVEAKISVPARALGYFNLKIQARVEGWTKNAETNFVRIKPHTATVSVDSIFQFSRVLGGSNYWVSALWDRIEPERGKYDWAYFDNQFKEFEKTNQAVGYCAVWYVPNWMVKDPEFIKKHGHYGYLYGWSHIPDDFRLYADFAAKVVARQGDRVKAYNMWNEPEFFWGGSPLQYMQMLKTAYVAMKQKDPRAEIMIGGSTGRGAFLAECYKAIPGAKHYFDIVQIHYMSINTPQNATGVLNTYRKIMAEAGDSLKPIINTEEGNAGPTGEGVATDFQTVQSIVNAYVVGIAEDVDLIWWFPGMFEWPSRLPRPVAPAASTMVHLLEGADVVAKPDLGKGVNCYTFGRGKRRIDVIWTQGGENKTVKIKRTGKITITDVMGNSRKAEGPQLTLDLVPGISQFVESDLPDELAAEIPPRVELYLSSPGGKYHHKAGETVEVHVKATLKTDWPIDAVDIEILERGGQKIKVETSAKGPGNLKSAAEGTWKFKVKTPSGDRLHPVNLLARLKCKSRGKDHAVLSGPLTFIPEMAFGFPITYGTDAFVTDETGVLKFYVNSTYKTPIKGTVELALPKGWKSDPAPKQELAVDADGTTEFKFDIRLTPEAGAVGKTEIPVYAQINGKRVELFTWTAHASNIRQWRIIGPFDNKNNTAFDTVFPPEKGVDLEATYDGAAAQKIRWQVHNLGYKAIQKIDNLSGIDFTRLYDPNSYVCGYALLYITSPKEQKVHFLIGSDDEVKVWVNDKLVWKNKVERAPKPDEDDAPVTLKQGKNKVLVKITQALWGWALYFRVADDQGNPVPGLSYSIDP